MLIWRCFPDFGYRGDFSESRISNDSAGRLSAGRPIFRNLPRPMWENGRASGESDTSPGITALEKIRRPSVTTLTDCGIHPQRPES